MYSYKRLGFFSISGNLATQFIQAVGWAIPVIKGDTRIASGWIGDGATAEADFHGADLRPRLPAPVILNVVNNQWAISSFQSIAGGEHHLGARRRLRHCRFASTATTSRGHAASAGGGARAPTSGPRSSSGSPTAADRTHLRRSIPVPARGRVAAFPARRPHRAPQKHLIGLGIWSEEEHEAQKELEADVLKAQKEAERFGSLADGHLFSNSTMFDDIYKDVPEHLRRQRRELGV
jgi:2-oxoisovalerate dehydrogenase E1 component alpha subunit